MNIKIKENALLACIAARSLRSERMAITVGCTIYLWKTDAATFRSDSCWVRHELKHVEQYLRYGWILFLLWYTWESLVHGYRNNRFELEARAAENDTTILETYLFAA
ncbi:hypothetical protein D3C71_192860 [compost metagenome]